jgi:hypothetical protein
MSRRSFRVLATALVLGAVASGSPTSAAAWEPIYPTRPVWRLPVPYSLNSAGSPDLGGVATTETEVRRGMDDWTLVACTSLTTSYRGRTSATPGSYEGISTIGWVESGWEHGSSAIGVTGPRWGSNIIEADMEMNGVNYTWTTASGSGSRVNAYSIILHEGGHYYGLGHSTVRGSSMWPSYSGGIVSLGPDDEAGICALYPGSGTDCTTTGCPSGQECVSGSCQPVMGDGSICSPCTSSADCGGAGALCLNYGSGGFCGQACRSDADCGGDTCVNTSGGPQCVRFVGGSPSCSGEPSGCARDSDCASDEVCSSGECVPRPMTGAELGGACTQDSGCRSGLCIGGVCTQTCDVLRPTSCPGGFFCDDGTSPSCSTGYCVAGSPGSRALGAACGADTECASLYCEAGVCSQPCVPGGVSGCEAGFTCQAGTLPCRGSCQRARSLGDACEGSDQCASGICAVRGDGSFCTQVCGDAAPCPESFTCTAAGDTSVCVPSLGGLDARCASDEECLSGICTVDAGASYCSRACDGATPCPSGFVCGPSESDASVCVREERSLAQDCVDNSDCASRLCAASGSDSFCTQICSNDAPCPGGFDCVSAGDVSVCRASAPPVRGGCGCASVGRRESVRFAWVGVALALLAWRRRRR